MFSTVSYKNSDALTKVRIWMYSLAYLHLSVVGIIMFSIDFRKAESPKVWIYQDIRFKLITCWFNLLSLVYLPMSVYCEFRKLRSQEKLHHVRILNRIRCLCFTSILLPTTTFSDVLFWILWNKDRELIAPVEVDEMAAFWTQHSMHTVSLVVVTLDLLLCPRRRPKDHTLGLTIMFVFLGAYISVSVHALLQGQYLYPILKLFSRFKLFLLVLYVLLGHYFIYTIQWFVIDIVWGGDRVQNNKRNYNISSYISSCELAVYKYMPIFRLTKSAASVAD